jgi:hypothetical protein
MALKDVAIYRDSDSQLIGGVTMFKTDPVEGYYYVKSITPITLIAGIMYVVCSIIANITDYYDGQTKKFGPDITDGTAG